jgi:hypothetical protein
LENYREYLSKKEESKGWNNSFLFVLIYFDILELSLKSTDDLLNNLSFLSKNELPKEV